jgi:hypothetical protein
MDCSVEMNKGGMKRCMISRHYAWWMYALGSDGVSSCTTPGLVQHILILYRYIVRKGGKKRKKAEEQRVR